VLGQVVGVERADIARQLAHHPLERATFGAAHGNLSRSVIARRFGSVNVLHCNPDETFALPPKGRVPFGGRTL